MKDEIESIPQKTDACETRTPHGSLGKTKQKIIQELTLSESQLKFQLDFLVEMCYSAKKPQVFAIEALPGGG